MYNFESRLVDSSRLLADSIVAEIDNEQERFNAMLKTALLDQYPVSMRAARIIDLCCCKNKNLIKPHLAWIIKLLPGFKVAGLKRSMLKILIGMISNLDDESMGQLTDLAFNITVDQKETIANRAYAIDILTNIAKIYSEIKPELLSTLEAILPEASPGIEARCRKVFKKFSES